MRAQHLRTRHAWPTWVGVPQTEVALASERSRHMGTRVGSLGSVGPSGNSAASPGNRAERGSQPLPGTFKAEPAR